MHTLLLQAIVLGAGLVTTLTVAGESRHHGDDPSSQSLRQEKPAAGARSGRTDRSKANRSQVDKAQQNAQQEAQRKRDQRRSSNHIAAAFPRTRGLLGYLEKNGGRAYDAVLRHSVKLTRRREAAALRLAKEHHRELQKLILRSKRRYPKAYNSAIRELVADYARLQRAKQLGEKEFSVALTEWKIRSKVRLVAAQMTVDNQPELQKQLETLLAQGEQAKRRQVQQQIRRYQDQIRRLQRRLDQDPARNVKRQLRAINSRVKPNKRRGK